MFWLAYALVFLGCLGLPPADAAVVEHTFYVRIPTNLFGNDAFSASS
jgi:hypothetical protein